MTSKSSLASPIPALIGLGLLAASGLGHAALLTSAPAGGTLVIDFDGVAGFNVIGPVQIGGPIGHDVTVASTSSFNGLYFSFDGWGMVDNGEWKDRTYVGLNSHNDVMEFAFNDAKVKAVGGQIGYARGYSEALPLIITVLDGNRNVLESYNLSEVADIVTPNAVNGSEFRGIARDVADIAYFQISGGEANALDDLTLSYAPVPLPGTLAMALGGVAVLARRVRRRA